MVYVDNMDRKFGRMIMCHLFADTIEELFQMVDKIGVNRKWFQKSNKLFPHFDICRNKKLLALKVGAKEVAYREIVEIIKNIEKLSDE